MAHPSSFALEKFAAGDASERDRSSIEEHLGGCQPCRERVATMKAQAASFSNSSHSSPARERVLRADRAWRRNAVLVTLVPAAAAVALFVAAPWKSSSPAPIAVNDPPTSVERHGRTPLELRPDLTPARLRSLSIRGQDLQVGQGSFEAAEDDGRTRPFVLEHTDVSAEVTGFVGSVTVTQRFRNPFPKPVEAIYVFPLPENAAVDQMTLTAGTRTIRAVIRKREQARREYEEAKAQGRRAALLDQERPNIFTQSVANLLPGETVQVTLRYVAPLQVDDGAYTFNFPMVVGPRYVPGAALAGESQGTGTSPDTTRVIDASRITPPAERTGRDISVRVRLEAGTPIEDLWSVSHRLSAERISSSQAVISLDVADRVPNRDFVLRWKVSGTENRAAVLASGGPGGTFALMLNPEAAPTNAEVMPKEMVFVIDTSCSMGGAPLDAAKRAMTMAMQQMNPRDTFMLIDFADRASSFHDTPLPNTPGNVQRALKYLESIPASGGTNQLDGIRRALERPADPSRLRIVLLMTDGFIGNEREIFAQTLRLMGGARVFGFGVGGSVNHYLLARLSEVGRGFYQYVRTDEDPTPAVSRFVRRIAKPLLTDVALEWKGVKVDRVLPTKIPDLFDAQPLVVLGRYETPGTGTLVVRGLQNGKWVELSVPVVFSEKPTAEGLSSMWARARIEEIDRLQHFGEFNEAVQEITTLGLEHHLVTAYTSFVAVEDRPVTSGPTLTVAEPTVPPDDSDGVGDGKLVQRRHNTIQIIRGSSTETDRTIAKPVDKGTESSGSDDDFDSLYGSRATKKPDPSPRREVFIPPPPPKSRDLGGALDPKGGEVDGRFKDEISQGDVLEVVLSHKAELAQCVSEARRVHPEQSGKIVLQWVVEPSGRVRLVRVIGGDEHAAVTACLLRVFKQFVFPKALHEATFQFPLKY